ncbi:glutamine--fructose-6-phosphate aminotransferase [Terasakiispira papahanaumokuakeensis]|uniref:Glutamine--fructose-6-phosphate aminotransferase [isomerizing] n=1 Tax=Terasakiispira papahanaumokuakeensis TaxID=197479 RepID=A0A1E2VCW4_9GAMM|nr:glutamine--fructose-6-phosphate transaminase (isomerizing) [Terasakiispira papahanaumokuakeensis]ODC04821.1 glutamine--fructose-6-phosphate aminotransferase [Terasakiispira papahanaumokuakeensis]
MCGIVGAVAERPVGDILLEGLRRLEYRGYDSAGVAIREPNGQLSRRRAVGKVAALEAALSDSPLNGSLGIAHTRWATHGRPTQANAHPHMAGDGDTNELALVHNGIIENYEPLRRQLEAEGVHFSSETDTEVMAHLIRRSMQTHHDLLQAVHQVVSQLEGAYAIAVIHRDAPQQLVCARKGSPLVIGAGMGEHFCGSDPLALLQVTDRFAYLEEGDVARLHLDHFEVLNAQGQPVERPVIRWEHGHQAASKGDFKHFMLKEIHEQPQVLADTLEGRLAGDHVLPQMLGSDAMALLPSVKQVQIVACGTSYHAGMVARYWIERLAGVPCQVEVASEYRYRQVVVPEATLFITISQSGETADTLAALRFAKTQGYLGSLAICNVPGSSLMRESDLTLMTHAGPEIGVASTKAFTTQLTALLLLTLALRQAKGLDDATTREIVDDLRQLPTLCQQVLDLDTQIERLSAAFAEKHHALFLGRGTQFPIALEGALKLKEISYIHAEAYPAGELKHGPLALVDRDMPVIAVAPNDDLLEKLKSNLQEVGARGGELFVFADHAVTIADSEQHHVVKLPAMSEWLAPILFTVPLQLLSYHVAILKGTDVDQPRNLAKSVTVE